MDSKTYYEGFTDRWTPVTEDVARSAGVDSILIMKATDTHMVTAASGGPAREIYVPGGAGPKSVVPGHHKLYCEQVMNDDRPLVVDDAASDPEWSGNEDLVKFGMGFYLGYPVHDANGTPIGTVCALHTTRPGDEVVTKLNDQLSQVAREVEADLLAHRT